MLTRYSIGEYESGMQPDPDGLHVRHDDAMAEITRLKELIKTLIKALKRGGGEQMKGPALNDDCVEEKCMWWNQHHEMCRVVIIEQALVELLAGGGE